MLLANVWSSLFSVVLRAGLILDYEPTSFVVWAGRILLRAGRICLRTGFNYMFYESALFVLRPRGGPGGFLGDSREGVNLFNLPKDYRALVRKIIPPGEVLGDPGGVRGA